MKKNLVPPQDLTMERQVLGMMLLKGGAAIPSINAILAPDDFYLDEHKLIYKTILKLFSKKIPPSILEIINELRKVCELNERLSEIVLSIGEQAFSTVYAETWSKKLKELSELRRLIKLTEKITHEAYTGKKSLNDIIADTETLIRSIRLESLSKTFKFNNYFKDIFGSDFRNVNNFSGRKTDFENIDENQIFSPGLYVLGGTPACGKTTFAWQLLEQFAEQGETCIFCSYEMSRFELFSKSLARELFISDTSSVITASDIRSGASSETMNKIISDFSTKECDLNLFELRDENIDDLLRIIRPYCNDTDKSPVVCVDYLQIIPPSPDVKLSSDKARIDDIVHKLKTFQRETNTTFIIISSFNRVNYYQQVSFESFKESGGIEYSADVVWALQMYVANTIKTGASISDTRKKFDDAKKQQPRAIQLKCLKNRQGNNYDCYFKYYSAHDYFMPATLNEFEFLKQSEEIPVVEISEAETTKTPLSKATQRKLDRVLEANRHLLKGSSK